ncbi:SIS domain-containing protein [Robertkochia solimangrovi]|uniref:SIS domain-containing protein n=1 Tax=Robertkochia solimangrovi TaxID=2213046 RepID=UPI00117EB474|nr:SIS domain-containing protein [Robertkochia solimangrovi]TRZ41858.1 sugar isomerase [Robertkochia solimangrovi]
MRVDSDKEQSTCYTLSEIEGQPHLWKKVFQQISKEEPAIRRFFQDHITPETEIVLTGAGSSAFIGEAVEAYVQKETGCRTRAIATTQLVTNPDLFLEPHRPTLLISFARSGNSPESIATVELADQICGENMVHLIITCNDEGILMNYARQNPERNYAILLPEESNDKSLAMTGSFTSMLLCILLIIRKKPFQYSAAAVEHIAAQGNHILKHSDLFNRLINQEFDRVVFLGSGPLVGIARECHLKLQELTDGKVICKHDSFLGFRHGPRAVVNEKTLVVYLFSNNDYSRKYEIDLARSINNENHKIACLSIGKIVPENLSNATTFELLKNTINYPDFDMIPFTLIGQLLGYHRSIGTGLNPDNPSVSGAINRVVQGVTIYPFKD